MSSHEKCHRVLDEGVFPREPSPELAQHLQTCEDCQKNLTLMNRLQPLKTAFPHAEAQIENRILNAWESKNRRQEPFSRWFLRLSEFGRVFWVPVITVGLILLAAGFSLFRSSPSISGSQESGGFPHNLMVSLPPVTEEYLLSSRIALRVHQDVSVKMEENHLFFFSGEGTLKVAPQDISLWVITPHARIEVLGTTFTLKTDSQQSSIHLESGKLRIIRENKEILLASGESWSSHSPNTSSGSTILPEKKMRKNGF
jgi:hypothetical protein